ncbi:hypothetical protein SAMN05216215_1017102 [Saccharopolyspora shandongensis]|uniref:Uncharacterized protein n=1 Tax=Saccharopolyspora shandongensis TaxID=418495 RepID=A0A1H3FNU1_9PSEU|nr:hypothetical protein [Saccharopolyspora shandongensis]SDX92621.1 hypothetical protein SAMN05216215_1017102 [Saccharopolyspora shandongensis]
MLVMLPVIAVIVTAPALFFLAMHWKADQPQHAGGGEGALTVWQLIANVEAERQQRSQPGRHRLREPAPDDEPQNSTSDTEISAPPQEIQQRILEALHRL